MMTREEMQAMSAPLERWLPMVKEVLAYNVDHQSKPEWSNIGLPAATAVLMMNKERPSLAFTMPTCASTSPNPFPCLCIDVVQQLTGALRAQHRWQVGTKQWTLYEQYEHYQHDDQKGSPFFHLYCDDHGTLPALSWTRMAVTRHGMVGASSCACHPPKPTLKLKFQAGVCQEHSTPIYFLGRDRQPPHATRALLIPNLPRMVALTASLKHPPPDWNDEDRHLYRQISTKANDAKLVEEAKDDDLRRVKRMTHLRGLAHLLRHTPYENREHGTIAWGFPFAPQTQAASNPNAPEQQRSIVRYLTPRFFKQGYVVYPEGWTFEQLEDRVRWWPHPNAKPTTPWDGYDTQTGQFVAVLQMPRYTGQWEREGYRPVFFLLGAAPQPSSTETIMSKETNATPPAHSTVTASPTRPVTPAPTKSGGTSPGYRRSSRFYGLLPGHRRGGQVARRGAHLGRNDLGRKDLRRNAGCGRRRGGAGVLRAPGDGIRIVSKEELYEIHDNGGRPWIVGVDEETKRLTLYKWDAADNDVGDHGDGVQQYDPYKAVDGWTRLPYQTLWLGREPSPEYDGNTIVFAPTPEFWANQKNHDSNKDKTPANESRGQRLVCIGSSIQTFRLRDADEQVVSYHSPIGNSDVPYPYLVTTRRTYLVVEGVCVDNGRRNMGEDPYQEYYGLGDPITTLEKVKGARDDWHAYMSKDLDVT